MRALSSTLRNQLERTVIAARDAAEAGAAAALERLAVDRPEPFGHMSADQRALRVKLRAKGRQLGDERQRNGEQDIWHLHRECAYEVWHQMLFARFLAENHLLMHPSGVPVTLGECEELAKDEGTDGWTLAARYASRMLPQIFRPDDPPLGITLAPEDKQELEGLLAGLPTEVFTADDSLGWVYQFWQSKEKDRVNESGDRIGADELPAVTQLFTEDYMVLFLLHNTIGAWWAGKRLDAEDAESAETEEELRQKVSLPGVDWEYLRFVREEANSSNPESEIRGPRFPWRPAAGTFSGWPKRAAELKIIDPCCGSGHFLVAAFDLMVRIRIPEEGLDPVAACDAVLRDNLFGLEIDERCCQIAAFALAFAAWTFRPSPAGPGGAGGAGVPLGYRPLPELHIACTGIGPEATEEQWLKLAEESGRPMPKLGREPILNGLRNLHSLFSQASVLGSLIDPNQLPSDLIAADYETLQPYLTAALNAERVDEDVRQEAVAAAGMVVAAQLLAGEYQLVVTNVPYLGRGKQNEALKTHLEQHYDEGKADLATAFVLRCLDFCADGGSTALVSPQNWLFLTSYRKQRELLLRRQTWNAVARLGPGAFETITGEVVNVALLVLSMRPPDAAAMMVGIDASPGSQASGKSDILRGDPNHRITTIAQAEQFKNPDSVVLTCRASFGKLLSEFAQAVEGLSTGDGARFTRGVWEVDRVADGWELFHGPPPATQCFGGQDTLLYWQDGEGELARSTAARVQGHGAWTKHGVIVGQMSTVKCALYSGAIHDKITAAIIPNSPDQLPAIWAFCQSAEYNKSLRRINTKLNVATATLVKVPFDEAHWQKVAADLFSNGLPEPESDDPTQWLFHGRPEASNDPLQVAVARLLGYRWPAELDSEMPLSHRARELVRRCDELVRFADPDGIACIPSVCGEEPAAARLTALLAACGIQPDRNLDEWLRDSFFEEHFKLFHHRPFVWHIWDGRRKDGFHALVNYHKLDRKLLEKLIYQYLGDWIARQKAAEERGESGAEARRLGAEELQNRLKLILAGEAPYDIFVRWKPLDEQAIGWDPDLNDGVRMNIRPFVEAGVLRKNPNIKWTKDRGKEPERDREQFPWFWEDDTFTGDRVNDIHLALADKRAAREATPRAKRDASPRQARTLLDDDDESEYEPAVAGIAEEQANDVAEDDVEADDRQEGALRFDDMELEDILAAVRQVLATGGPRDRETAIREVFDLLPGDRLTARIRAAIDSALVAATHRGITYTDGGYIYSDCRHIGDYPRELLKKYLLSVTKSTWWDQDAAIRATARHLGFRRAGPQIQAEFVSAIRGAIRQGLIERDGNLIRRRR